MNRGDFSKKAPFSTETPPLYVTLPCSGKLKLDTEGVEIGHGKDVRYTREKLPWTSLLPP